MRNSRSQNLALYLPIVIFLVYIGWWIGINHFNAPSRDNFTDSYGLIAATGAISGVVVAKKWGLFKSSFGRALGFFAIGLFMQFLGQLIYALYFRLGNVELAFPSVGDIPFLLTGIFYILAIVNLLRVIVYKGSIFKPRTVLVISIALTVGLAWLMWVAFLHLAVHDDRGTIYSLTNAAYPIIQAFYFLLGLIAIMQARRMAGGKMLKSVSIVLLALVVQYAADFNFLYQSYKDTWQPAASNDLFYVFAYGLMAFAILMIDRVRRKIVAAPVSTETVEMESNSNG